MSLRYAVESMQAAGRYWKHEGKLSPDQETAISSVTSITNQYLDRLKAINAKINPEFPLPTVHEFTDLRIASFSILVNYVDNVPLKLHQKVGRRLPAPLISTTMSISSELHTIQRSLNTDLPPLPADFGDVEWNNYIFEGLNYGQYLKKLRAILGIGKENVALNMGLAKANATPANLEELKHVPSMATFTTYLQKGLSIEGQGIPFDSPFSLVTGLKAMEYYQNEKASTYATTQEVQNEIQRFLLNNSVQENFYGNYIKNLIYNQKTDIFAVAADISMDHGDLSKILNGQTIPRVDTFAKILYSLGHKAGDVKTLTAWALFHLESH